MITGLFFVLLGLAILFYPQILVALIAGFLMLFGLGMTPPPVCWPKAGRWAFVQVGVFPATRVPLWRDAKQVVG